ncbi:uncharacterized protein LOC126766062 [Bactrocera neohumeralis]|uniref:uncharacterized protein LOC126766062 n=1 Tax=Bactrocera neohumeralis TaxID=98809 RepID=UPI002166809B|nr:uncharacterized protein LOC126766062 [Bactrocera neohumeralis]
MSLLDSPNKDEGTPKSDATWPAQQTRVKAGTREGGQHNAIEAVGVIRLPQFLPSDPDLWFTQINGLLHINRLTSDVSKYYTVITALDAETLRRVSDVARNPPNTGKYDKLKRELIARFELFNKKPSQLLREMRDLDGNNVSNEGLSTFWLQRMPNNVRCILSACKSTDLQNLAEVADRVVDNSPSHIVASTTVPQDNEANCSALNISKQNTFEARILALETSFNQIIQKLSGISVNMAATMNQRHGSSAEPVGERSRSRLRENAKVCYYHIRFGAASRKCQAPCEFNKPTSIDATDGSVEQDISIKEQRPYIFESKNNLNFLIDSGSVISFVPLNIINTQHLLLIAFSFLQQMAQPFKLLVLEICH